MPKQSISDRADQIHTVDYAAVIDNSSRASWNRLASQFFALASLLVVVGTGIIAMLLGINHSCAQKSGFSLVRCHVVQHSSLGEETTRDNVLNGSSVDWIRYQNYGPLNDKVQVRIRSDTLAFSEVLQLEHGSVNLSERKAAAEQIAAAWAQSGYGTRAYQFLDNIEDFIGACLAYEARMKLDQGIILGLSPPYTAGEVRGTTYYYVSQSSLNWWSILFLYTYLAFASILCFVLFLSNRRHNRSAITKIINALRYTIGITLFVWGLFCMVHVSVDGHISIWIGMSLCGAALMARWPSSFFSGSNAILNRRVTTDNQLA